MLRRLMALAVALLGAACLSPAQQEAIRMQREINHVIAVSDACLAPIRADPAYRALYRRLAIEPTIPPPVPTPAQLADAGRPDRADVVVTVALHGELSVCRGPLIESIAAIAPGLAETAVDIWLRGDRMVLALMRGRITWCEANRDIGALQEEYYRRLTEVVAETRRHLDDTDGGVAFAAEPPPRPMPESIRRFPQDLAAIHAEMQAALAALSPR